MSSRLPRVAYPRHVVTTVLVSHDGERWLPDVLAGLRAQTRPPQQVVAVDTGSVDASAELLSLALGEGAVLTGPRESSYAAAVQAGLAAAGPWLSAVGGEEPPVEWIWLLHDDSAPDPHALQELLALAEDMPSAAIIGPKCRDWSGRQLLEMGITTDRSGHRHTGLDPREVDQGQHDVVREVLAVGSAGALVRRDVWDRLGGLDPQLPLLRDDLDLGWRANLAGERVVVAPRAVVRHAAAMSGRQRPADAVTRSLRRADRAHGMLVLLANVSRRALPATCLWLAVSGLVRVLALLLTRRAGAALDELAALLRVAALPVTVHQMRAARAGTRAVPAGAVRPLLARPGARLHDYLEHLGEGGARLVDPEALRRPVAVETGPTAEEAESLDTRGSGLLRHVLTRPGVLLFVGLSAVALVAERGLLSGALSGGRLLPPPGGASDLWSAYLSSWHGVGVGGGSVAPPYLALLAALSTVLLGKVWLAVDVLLLGCVPIAGTAAYRASRALTDNRALRLWAGAAYGLLPVATGAVAAGRLGAAVAAMAVPPLLHAGVRVLRRDPRAFGWRQAFAAGLLLAVASAFAPLLYLVAAFLLLAGVVIVVVAAARAGRDGPARRSLAALTVLAVPPALLLPWTGRVATHPVLFVAGVGLPAPGAVPASPAAHALLFLSPGGPGVPPAWLFAPLALAAVVAPARARRAAPGLLAWLVAGTGLAASLVLSRLTVLPPGGDSVVPVWPGVATAVTGAGLLAGALLAADGAPRALQRAAFGWRQPAAGLLAAVCGLVPVAAGLAWLVRGADDPLRPATGSVVPAFVAAELAGPQHPRLLALDERPDGSVRYTVVRDGTGPRLEAADLAPDPRAAGIVRRAVRSLVAGNGGAGLMTLATADVRFVLLRHGDPARVAALDRTAGLSRLAAQGTPMWRVVPPTGRLAVAAAASPTLGTPRRPVTGRVPAGKAGRLLVLAEPADPGWRATLDGRSLPRATAYGWEQAFRLPATGGAVQIHHDGGLRGALLGVEAALLAAVLVLAAPSARREQPTPTAGPPAGPPGPGIRRVADLSGASR